MKGRYSGSHMTIYGTMVPGTASIASWANRVERLSVEAKYRLKIIDWHKSHNNNKSLTARRFGISRREIRTWFERFNQCGVMGLNNLSRRPKNTRKPTILYSTIQKIIDLRKQYPAWSKYKIGAILRREGMTISDSAVGRTLTRKNLINKRISIKRKRSAKNPKKRFPKGMKIASFGDMIQMDTKHVNLIGGKAIHQFTAIDVLGKKRVLRYYSSLSSKNGADFLNCCVKKFPFTIKNVQSDNGPEFQKDFDKLCRKLNLPHYYIYPRTPKQNTYVEISHGADQREFYSRGVIGSDIDKMNEKLQEWEFVWNGFRPHEALNQLTPNEYFTKYMQGRLPTRNVIILQA
jgi:transposase InsO family protein